MFPIYYGQLECGNATIEKQGLYCRIYCKCNLPTKEPCKVILKTLENSIHLGTFLKVGDTYIVDTKIPSKYISGKKIEFRIVGPRNEDNSEFFPIREDMPFPHLHMLNRARMRQFNGQIGVIFTE